MSKKQTIINSAIELFSIHGIDATSVQQITEHSGISKGAFYLSFKSKSELITAITDYFIENVLTKVDQAVRTASDPHYRIVLYFEKTLEIMEEYASLADILMKEPHHANPELQKRMAFFDQMMDQYFLQLLKAAFGSAVEHSQYDLTIVMRGLFQTYAQQYFLYKIPLDIKRLAQSLLEKTTILAQYMKQPYLTTPLISQSELLHSVDENLLDKEIYHLMSSLNDSIAIESLRILRQEIQKPLPNSAILNGMLLNLSQFEQAHWLNYLIKQQYSLQ